jgi:hypothetical protein
MLTSIRKGRRYTVSSNIERDSARGIGVNQGAKKSVVVMW